LPRIASEVDDLKERVQILKLSRKERDEIEGGKREREKKRWRVTSQDEKGFHIFVNMELL